jgi:ribose-phosphate pyrophosphokinase
VRPLIYAWPGREALAAALAPALDGEVSPLDLRRFPDGEIYVRLADAPRDRHVVLACGLDNPDDKSTGIYFAAATARELGARSVGLVAPYLAYLRQDARFRDGEAIASRAFGRWLSATVDWLVTLDPHLHRHASLDEVYTIPSLAASSAGAIAQWISANVPNALIVGPDAESAQWAGAVAMGAGCPHVVLDKTRRGDRDVEIRLPPLAQWRGRTVVLLDDIISTAHTMATAAVRLRDAGFAAPVCIGVHALFAGDALQALRGAGVSRVVTCNTVPHATNAIDVFGTIASAARGMLDKIRMR